ncbi:hypothetical protein QOZ91_002384 [Clostridium sardiniense]|nr:hypothetical protein [Clostridium sardiniense]
MRICEIEDYGLSHLVELHHIVFRVLERCLQG